MDLLCSFMFLLVMFLLVSSLLSECDLFEIQVLFSSLYLRLRFKYSL